MAYSSIETYSIGVNKPNVLYAIFNSQIEEESPT